MKQLKQLKLEQFPKEGDVACLKDNIDNDFYWFQEFSKEDEKIAKANKKFYYIIYTMN